MTGHEMGSPGGNGRYPHLRSRWRPFRAAYREVPLSASYVQRAGGSLLDGVVFLGAVPLPLEAVLFFLQIDLSARHSRIVFWSGAALFTIVYSWIISQGRRSIGQLAVGIAVAGRVDSEPPSFPQAVVRTVVKLLGFAGWAYAFAALMWGAPDAAVLILTPFGLGLLWPVWDDRGRAWHDIVSSTRAISV